MLTTSMILQDLTAEQRSAVISRAHELIILAGAGSGKTRVLVHRVAWLIQECGLKPSELMVVTFTVRAAREMKSRLLALFGGDDAAGEFLAPMLCGTFHAIALQMLNEWGHLIGFRQGEAITVHDEEVASVVLLRVCKDLGLYREKNKTWAAGLSLEKVTAYRESMANSGQPPTGLGRLTTDAAETVYREYRTRLRRNNAVDYGLMLGECGRLLEVFDVQNHFHARIRHVLVDELQDTDAVQYGLHGRFCPPADWTGVGDPRQTIFSWRGARPDLMTQLHPDAQVIDLQDNFRSSPEIVEAANRLIACNGDSLARPMRAVRTDPGRVECAHGPLSLVAEQIGYMLKNELLGPEDIAVLARTHDWLDAMQVELDRLGIPYARVGRERPVSSTPEFQAVHAALAFAANPHDGIAFRMVEPWLGLEQGEAAMILLDSHRKGVSVLAAYLESTRERLRSGLAELLDGRLRPDAAGAAEQVCTAIHGRVTDVAGYWAGLGEGLTIAEALRVHGLRDRVGERERPDGVTLSTIHAVKGCEWVAIIIVGMCEGSLPHLRDGAAGLPEERRLAYVAMTRACERLLVVVPSERVGIWYARGDGPPIAPSRFVGEAGIGKPAAIRYCSGPDWT